MRSRMPMMLWMAGGPVIWAAHFAAVYGYTAIVCARGLAPVLGTDTVAWTVTLMTLVAGACVMLLYARAVRHAERRFERWVCASVAALALFAMVLETVPAWIVPPCA